MDESLRKRIADIQRLMNAAGTVGEAEAAAAAMHRIVLKHNLTAEDLHQAGETERETYTGQRIRLAPDRTPGLQWRVNLATVLAHHHFCTFIRYGSHGAAGVIVGQPSNIEVIQELFAATVETINRIADYDWYQLKVNVNFWRRAGSPTAMGWKNSFKLGFVDGLNARLTLERRDQLALDNKVQALVLVKDEGLKEAVDEIVGKTVNSKGSSPTTASGYHAGVEKGRTHSLRERLGT